MIASLSSLVIYGVDCFLLACCMLTGEGRIDALFEFCRLEIAFVLGLLSFYDQKLSRVVFDATSL